MASKKPAAPLTDVEQARIAIIERATTISDIADIILIDWRSRGGVHPFAAPYLTAMRYLGTIRDNYGADSGAGIVARFLGPNSASYRGPIARAAKAKLKAMLGGGR